MFGLGTKEIIIIAVIAILLFGSKKIPELAKSLAEAIRHITGIFKSSDVAHDGTANTGKKKS
jgi:sec-independent protein translocase protein TatA